MGLCLASAGVVKSLAVASFMLSWTHSVEKIEWQEDWRVTPQGLEIVEARVKGSGAGMEPPPEARLANGWFHWTPKLPVLPEVALGNSGMAGEWRLCSGGVCQTLSGILGMPAGPVTTMRACDMPANVKIGDAAPMTNGAIAAEHVAVLIARAGALVEAKQFDKAIDSYDEAIRLDPNSARLFALRAAAFASMHEPRLAIRDYTESVRLDPGVMKTYTDRAAVFRRIRRFDLAIDDLTEALRRDPASADLYDSRGQVYAHNNAYDRAIADYNEAIRLRPAAAFYLNRGIARQLKDELDPAIADYKKAIELDGKLALAYNNRGMALRAQGHRPRALADFTTAIRLDPTLDVAVAHRKDLAREIERLGARMPLKGKDTGR
ncbi:DUF1850 domain-containing protein [Bradyrhizobiaceae bacterium SG-6C]|nr:DUF1850 domain-containing protein [Bradyrhizobiaceae bacterium SG-6C]